MSDQEKAPQPGDTVYSRDGLSGEYVAPFGGSHIVRPWVSITSWDGEESYGEPGGLDVWPETFPAPPVALLEAEIMALQGQIDAKRHELSVATDEAAGFIRNERERMARLTRHEALARLEDFLEGRITHVVKIHYGTVTIHEFKEVATPDSRYDRDGLKLLTLYGKPNQGLQWKLSEYSDGSGQNYEVIPCFSREEALRLAEAELNKSFQFANAERTYSLRSAVQSADALGIEVPTAARERVQRDLAEERAARLKQLRDEIEKIETAVKEGRYA